MSDPYTNHIIKLIIAQYAKQHGFSLISENSMCILVEVVIDYVYKLSKFASESATHCGRTDCNILDLSFSLNKVSKESLESLHHFYKLRISKEKQEPKLDFNVQNYPKPIIPLFYMDQKNENDNNTFYPFRKYVNYISKPESSEIPSFYPDFPPEYTYKKEFVPNKHQISQIELDKQRSKEQKILQSEIENLTKDTANQEKNTITIQTHVINALSTGLTNEPVPDTTHPHLIFHGFSQPVVDPEKKNPSQLRRLRSNADDDEFEDVSLPSRGYISEILQESRNKSEKL